MRAKGSWTIQSFITCFIFNAVLLGVLYYAAARILEGFHQWLTPFLSTTAPALPEDVRQGFQSLSQFVKDGERYLMPVLLGFGGTMTFLLWLVLALQGRGIVARAHREAVEQRQGPSGAPVEPAKTPKSDRIDKAPPSVDPVPAEPSPQPAIQMLGILQREGRFIDFLQEDLSLYEDSQIGAAVRNIHQGCRDALKEYVELRTVYEEAEGDSVTVPSGFDARAVRLSGEVSGNPPFRGIIRHRGWRVVKIELPKATTEAGKDWIVAPAEVEVGGTE